MKNNAQIAIVRTYLMECKKSNIKKSDAIKKAFQKFDSYDTEIIILEADSVYAISILTRLTRFKRIIINEPDFVILRSLFFGKCDQMKKSEEKITCYRPNIVQHPSIMKQEIVGIEPTYDEQYDRLTKKNKDGIS
jgi:hypothetical protein